jgi:hypothetical protein
MIPLVVASGALTAFAVASLPRRWRAAGAAAITVMAVWQRPPLQSDAPMVTEAQWETPWRRERETVTHLLAEMYDGTPILASMGSLGHYMQEAASYGLRLSDFLHEGNGDLWAAATARPSDHVRWVLIEERAEGGDELAARARADVNFLNGFERVAEGGGMVLYKKPGFF